MFDIDFVRQNFPQLGDGFAYFDNAGGSLTLERVAHRIADYLLQTDVQLGATYRNSQLASQRVTDSIEALRCLINAQRAEEIILGASSSQLLANLALALSGRLIEGDEIIVSNLEHSANSTPWLRLKQYGVVIKVWKARSDDHRLHIDDLDSLVSDRTRLVCINHVSNVTGAIAPVAKICKKLRAMGVMTCVDGVAYAPHRAVDVQVIGADFYVLSLYKLFGSRSAMLYGRYDTLQLELDNINHPYLDRHAIPYKFQPGGFSYEAAYGAAGIVDYLIDLADQHHCGALNPREKIVTAYALMQKYEAQLVQPLLEFIDAHPRLNLLGPNLAEPRERVGIVSFVAKDITARELVAYTDARNIGLRSGHFNSRQLLSDINLLDEGVIRLSLAHYNTENEIQHVIETLREFL